jgi:hypothetical protein
MNSDNKYLLKECRLFHTKNNFIVEHVDPGFEKIIMKGKLQEAEAMNHNERWYPMEILEREVDQFNQLIKEGRSVGELDHPDNAIVNLANASHIIRELWWQGKELWGRVELLNGPEPYSTPSGRILEALVRRGVTLGISSRGIGSTQQDEQGREVVQPDYQLITWDFVSNPSTKQAFMLKENRYYQISKKLTVEEANKLKYVKLNNTLSRILKG